ncbi:MULTISPECIES: 50S ribosomal protein L18 [Ureaplasma]|uniref:Large ribosomal subunit protein uL18 n=2 Tax=Ureaplasma TaxID=2129 RepID=A0ABT3BNR7_9BACT|nr:MULTISPECIES: 50S ribosomal protein L18 [Ureaplasma]MCV3728398.1 50S ribosomal protein L18 [Ureaplasma miroungigenitalium]MCV3734185.1 50S ribosomal protein L18 [Ureaplasma miroungigenitalium]MCV3753889.1 50S ribosomal protein L18 [Ureaplasma zalophigenitalium]
MKRINFSRNYKRTLRARRIVKKIRALQLYEQRPVLVVNKTNAHIWVQLIDYNTNKTLASSSSLALKLVNGNKENAAKVGADIAKKATALNIKSVIFNKNGNEFHGRIKALADAAREHGLEF